MMSTRTAYFDPETLTILKGVLEAAASKLPHCERDLPRTRADLAANILAVAGGGERDPVVIERRALLLTRKGDPAF
jgi:hypothetical protein